MTARAHRWRVLRRVVVAAFLVAVMVLLMRHAHEVEWTKVAQALLGYTPGVLAASAGIAAASYLLYASFDLLARGYAGHNVHAARTLAIAAVSYAFNVNLGALVGGLAFRYRLYSRFGLRAGTVAQVYTFAVVTNWSGYVLLLGIVLAPRLVAVPDDWKVGMLASQAVGSALLAAVAAYLALCAYLPRRTWYLRGLAFRFPMLRLGVLQLTLSAANWMLMAAIVHLLLQRQVAYPTVLGTLLLAAIAGAMAHIPAGLGVLEAVFVLMLSDRVPTHELIAALLAYRAAYYLGPLLLALLAYPLLELHAARRAQYAEERDRRASEGI